MTKLITILIVIGVLFTGWHLFLYWEKVKNEEETAAKQEAAELTPEHLPGMTYALESSLKAALEQGPDTMAVWLKNYGHSLQDPRKAWIELDYVQILSRQNPAEAKRIYAAVRDRIKPDSPVYPRVKKLEKTYN